MTTRKFALTLLALPLITAAAPTVQGSANYYRLRWAQMLDRTGFGQPVEAARILIPANWRFEGEVTWGPATGCAQNLIHPAARASDQTGTYGIEIFMPYTWQWHDDPYNRQTVQQQSAYVAPAIRPCEMRPLTRATDFIRQAVIPRYRQGARIVSVEQLSQVARARHSALMNELSAYIQAGVIRGAQVDAGRVMITYQVNGRAVEEWITGTIETTAAPAMSASAAMGGGLAQVNSYSVTATSLIATRAPAGELQRQSKMYASIIGSIRVNPRWVMALKQVFTNIGKVAIDESAKRAAIWREASQYTGNIITQQYQAQQAVQDRLAQSFSQSVRGTETFYDPAARERVQLTGGYTHAWSNGQGEYILSDDPNFNPATALQGTWSELQRTGR